MIYIIYAKKREIYFYLLLYLFFLKVFGNVFIAHVS